MKFGNSTSSRGCHLFCCTHCWVMMLLMVSSIVHGSPKMLMSNNNNNNNSNNNTNNSSYNNIQYHQQALDMQRRTMKIQTLAVSDEATKITTTKTKTTFTVQSESKMNDDIVYQPTTLMKAATITQPPPIHFIREQTSPLTYIPKMTRTARTTIKKTTARTTLSTTTTSSVNRTNVITGITPSPLTTTHREMPSLTSSRTEVVEEEEEEEEATQATYNTSTIYSKRSVVVDDIHRRTNVNKANNSRTIVINRTLNSSRSSHSSSIGWANKLADDIYIATINYKEDNDNDDDHDDDDYVVKGSMKNDSFKLMANGHNVESLLRDEKTKKKKKKRNNEKKLMTIESHTVAPASHIPVTILNKTKESVFKHNGTARDQSSHLPQPQSFTAYSTSLVYDNNNTTKWPNHINTKASSNQMPTNDNVSTSSSWSRQMLIPRLPTKSLTHLPRKVPTRQRYMRQALNDEQLIDKCRMFVEGDTAKNEFYSPDYPNDYPANINCTRVITAPRGQIIRLDFRNSFHIEAKEECKFDFLEIRDGQYGFSNLIGKYCGTDFPPEITSRERYLWLHFHSDESIEYSGFTAVYEFIERNRDAPTTDLNCTIEKDGFEGFVNSTDIPQDIRETVIRNKIPIDCMWRIQVQDKWKIQVKFFDFKLSKPNDCETNFLDIFPEQTVMPLRVKNFCGSAGEGVTSDSNILHMRFYAEQIAINSSFAILYTAFRDRASNANCVEGEYDCEDATCIAADLRCNGRDNCKFRWDEEGCKADGEGQKEHMIIIITVFGLILGGMVLTFLVNCIRKILHDQKIIREHIRQSKESKLDEMGRHSKARSRDNLSTMASRQKHSQTSLQILDDVSNRYYREMEAMAVQSSSGKEKDHSILRHRQQQHDMIVQTSLCSTTNTTDESTTTNTTTEPIQPLPYVTPSPPPPPLPQPMPTIASTLKSKQPTACDMACQTRESLFSTVSLWRHKSKTPSVSGGGGSIGRKERGTIEAVPPPPRFSTFGYDTQPVPSSNTLSSRMREHVHRVQETIEMEPLQTNVQMMQHQHLPQQYQHQQQQQQQLCQYHQQLQQQQQQQHILPRQHQHKHQHINPAVSSLNAGTTTTPAGASVTTAGYVSQKSDGGSGNVAAGDNANKTKQTKMDESKIFIDIRNSAPDVIIMTSH